MWNQQHSYYNKSKYVPYCNNLSQSQLKSRRNDWNFIPCKKNQKHSLCSYGSQLKLLSCFLFFLPLFYKSSYGVSFVVKDKIPFQFLPQLPSLSLCWSNLPVFTVIWWLLFFLVQCKSLGVCLSAQVHEYELHQNDTWRGQKMDLNSIMLTTVELYNGNECIRLWSQWWNDKCQLWV